MKVAISRTGDGEHFTRDHRDVTIRLDLPQLSVHEIEFDHTFEVPEHRHDHVDALYVLAGTVEFLSGGTSVRVGPDTLVAAPAGAPHGFRNAGPRKARVLVLHAPDGGFADRVRNSSQPSPANRDALRRATTSWAIRHRTEGGCLNRA